MKLSKLSMAICLCAGCSLSFAFEAGTFEVSYPGIGGMVPVKVTFSKDKIEKIEVDPNKETVGIGQNAIASISSEVVKTQSLAVDNVTGATVTSKALLDGIKECVQKAKGDVAQLTKKKNIAPVIAKTETINTDLVIVGGGAAGMIAAINAADQHLKVTLVEKMNFLGGASAICGGSVVTEGSQLQKDLGVKDDTPAKLAYDLLDNGHQKNDMNALVFYVNNVGKSIDWAVAKGVKFEKDFSFRAEWRTSRMVPLKGGCPAFAETLRELVKNAKVNVLLSIKAEQVNMTDGSATGITAVGKNGTKYIINAKAVLLATGGYGYNKEMLKGSLKDALYYGPVSSTGDGHKMAENAGAAMQLMDYGKLYPQGIEVAPGIAKSTLQGNIGAYNQAGIIVLSTKKAPVRIWLPFKPNSLHQPFIWHWIKRALTASVITLKRTASLPRTSINGWPKTAKSLPSSSREIQLKKPQRKQESTRRICWTLLKNTTATSSTKTIRISIDQSNS